MQRAMPKRVSKNTWRRKGRAEMLPGRLGLDKMRVPYSARYGVLWLDRGRLEVEAGCLRFVTIGGALPAGDYQIPQQIISIVLFGPGSSITHDALRLLANHGTALAAIGEGGVRFYTAPPLIAATSALARKQAELWAEPATRITIARKMYAVRFGEIPPHRDIEVLRGIEGNRVKEAYRKKALEFDIEWHGRHYDRANPSAADAPNQAINHASSAVQAAAAIAVCATATIPQLGFIHEDSAQAFVLDIADLFRDDVTLHIAFGAIREMARNEMTIDRLVRRRANDMFARGEIIPSMIHRVKTILADEEP
jgi:CRISPR-associated protein Cas1